MMLATIEASRLSSSWQRYNTYS